MSPLPAFESESD